MAMDAGKHVLVEKPSAASVAEMQEMKRHAELRGVACMPVHNCERALFPQCLRTGVNDPPHSLSMVFNRHLRAAPLANAGDD